MMSGEPQLIKVWPLGIVFLDQANGNESRHAKFSATRNVCAIGEWPIDDRRGILVARITDPRSIPEFRPAI